MPDFTFKVLLDADNLHLRAGKSHPAKIHVIMSYCEKADCSPSGIKQESENITFVHTLKQRVAPGMLAKCCIAGNETKGPV